MTDIRFATTLQILLTLANAARVGQPLATSTQLALGVGSTPSLVRRLLVPLGRDGIVQASVGKNGGVQLARPAREITLGEIYASVAGDKPLIVGRTGVPHLCDVSSRVEGYFASLAADVDRAVVEMLHRRTLEQCLDELLALKRPAPRRHASRTAASAR